LIESHAEVTFAVAWASSGHQAFDLIRKHATRISRAVIGTHFYQTHPDVLDAFRGKANVRFVLQPSGVFHPKLYLFRSDDRWGALIGSANLTSGALSTNSEAMLLIGGSASDTASIQDEILSLIDRYWKMGNTINKHEAKAFSSQVKFGQSGFSHIYTNLNSAYFAEKIACILRICRLYLWVEVFRPGNTWAGIAACHT
jgi:phosphatidylserine/phosphatidylglycerophosphate/cardiolipin synthase-like enzyme